MPRLVFCRLRNRDSTVRHVFDVRALHNFHNVFYALFRTASIILNSSRFDCLMYIVWTGMWYLLWFQDVFAVELLSHPPSLSLCSISLSLSLCLIITFIEFFFVSTFLFYFLFFHAIRFADSLHFIHMLTVLPCIRARFMANSISSCVGFNSVPHSWSDGMLKPSRECICFRLQPFDWHAFRIYTLSINSVLYISKDCSLSTCFFRFCCECEGFLFSELVYTIRCVCLCKTISLCIAHKIAAH